MFLNQLQGEAAKRERLGLIPRGPGILDAEGKDGIWGRGVPGKAENTTISRAAR